ncbi:MAG: hypothetical protein ACI85O_001232 [Saprospiraceae bacterium]|jgi:hypothetical protein
MKQTITNLFICLTIVCFNLQLSAQDTSYVKSDATGTNDGSSWDNAYITLHDALGNYNENDEIWVAAGTYLPENPSIWPDNEKRTFYIYQDVSIYGGFNGTETELDQRDPAVNVTILSGDINGDDVADDFDNNKEDNVINVVYAEASISTATTIDGFTIQGGYGDINDGVFTNMRGAGIFSYGAPQISNCYFTQNYTIWHAGGIYFYLEDAQGGKVENCIFEKNKCLSSGAGITIANVSGEGVTVENCQFLNNEAARGGGYCIIDATGTVDECLFSENIGTEIGGGIYTLYTLAANNLATTVNNCTFDSNVASNGGALFFGSDNGNNNQVNIQSSSFTNNVASAIGTDPDPDGGAIGVQYWEGNPQNCTIQIVDCLIENNTSEGNIGGIIVVNGSGSNNHFEIDNCQIFNNTTNGTIGGIWLIETGATTNSAKISNTHFKGNSATIAPGFSLSRYGTAPISRDVELVNCLFTENNTNSDASAVVGIQDSEFTLTNCTIANNDTPSIGFADGGTINLQNTILKSNDLSNLTVLNPISAWAIVSLGGNLISDDALNTSLNNTDQSSTDPLFEAGTFQLSENSPAVDAGFITDETPEFDLAGNDRVQGACLDIGAYESSYDAGTSCLSDVKESLVNASSLEISPNPVFNQLQISIENEWQGALHIQVVNALGQIVHSTLVEKNETAFSQRINVTDLPVGIYRLLASDGEEMMVRAFVKN